jgi:glycosyltransferase involved in cell wall biosynthesis
MFKSPPLISVIIPCYNGEKFIKDAIDSVINQTYDNFELIVVDDASKDKSSNIVNEFLSNHKVNYFKNISNIGIAKTKNRGLSLASGEYVAFLDQDDIWLQEKLIAQIRLFDEDVGVVCTGMAFTDKKLNTLELFNGFDSTDQNKLIKDLYFKPVNSSSIMMIRQKSLMAVGIFDESLRGWDDYELLMRIATRFKIRYVRKPLVKKRNHENNANRLLDLQSESESVFEKVLILHPFLKTYQKSKLAIICFEKACMLLEEDHRKLSIAMLKRCLDIKPTYIKALVLYMLILIFRKYSYKTLSIVSSTMTIVRRNIEIVKLSLESQR